MTNQQAANQSAFRACPNCGNLTPADHPACAYCGAVSVEAMAARQEAERERRFVGALFARSNPFSMVLIGMNAAVFLLEWLAGGMTALGADSLVIRAFGAKNNELIRQHHEYWRLITAMFIHIGFLHFLFNNYALWIIGPEIERIYGSARFVFLYMATGIVASLASYTFTTPDSAGASGAIFGLFGVMAAFAFRYRKELPERLSRDIKRRIVPVIAINLIFGFSVRIVDNAAHIGGLLAGVALTFLVAYKRPQEKTEPAVWRVLQVLLIIVTLASFIFAFRGYNGPPLSLNNLTKSESLGDRLQSADSALVESLKSFGKIINAKDSKADTQPALSAAERGIAAIKNIPKLEQQFDQERERLLEVLSEQRDLINDFAAMTDKKWTEIGSRESALIQKAAAYKLISR